MYLFLILQNNSPSKLGSAEVLSEISGGFLKPRDATRTNFDLKSWKTDLMVPSYDQDIDKVKDQKSVD